MSNESNKGDILRQYMNPRKAEEAPDGFTSAVMNKISSEKLPVSHFSWKSNMIPIVSSCVVVMLIVAAVLIPDKSGSVTYPLMNLFKDLNFSFPKMDFQTIFKTSLPSIVIYTMAGIIFLSLFDKALSGIFKKTR